MKISEKGIELIKRFEGCRLSAYKCPAGVATIGYGHTGADVFIGMNITQAQADALLKKDLVKFENKVTKYEQVYKFSQNEFDALVSFAFNIGSIDQLTANGCRSKAQIAESIIKYNKAGGRVLDGLTKRRLAEQLIFIASNSEKPTIKKGDRGDEVKEMQKLLIKSGYSIKADGIAGAKTDEALRAFQSEHGLVPDGICGKLTWNELLRV